MKNPYYMFVENSDEFSIIVAIKLQEGYILEEINSELPFAVLSKQATPVNHWFNFLIFCVTLGIWSFGWIYLINISKAKTIELAIHEDGICFEKLYNK